MRRRSQGTEERTDPLTRPGPFHSHTTLYLQLIIIRHPITLRSAPDFFRGRR